MSNGVGWLGLIGAGLIVLGISLLVLVDAPRRLLKAIIRRRFVRNVGVGRPDGTDERHEEKLPPVPRPVEPLWVTPMALLHATAPEPPPFVGSQVRDRL